MVCILRLIVLPSYEDRTTRYLAYITLDKVKCVKMSLSTDDDENVTLKMNSRFSNFSAFIPIRLKCQMWANFPGVDFLRTALRFRKRKKNSSSLVYVLCKAP